MRQPFQPDPDVLAALARAGLTRRSFLRRVGAGGALLASGGLLSACGIGGEARSQAGSSEEGSSPQPQQTVGGELNFSNWTLYIDQRKNKRPTLIDFREETGVKVNYFEDINSNDEYFAKVRNQLANGEDIGRDLMVLTDWMAGRLIELGWLEQIDASQIPNMDNLREGLQSPAFDPERQWSLPWQSGMTGIGYNPKLIGRKITSVNDLFADDLAGQVTFLSEMRDTTGLVMAAMGADPLNHEFSEYEAAIEKLGDAVGSGQVRAFTGNDYAADLAAGNIGAAIAWSGDVIQSQFENPDVQWVLPAEGGLLWSDNMLIPANAQHVANAHAFMNFVYRPQIAAQIAAWVNYITPVEGAQDAIAEIDESLADNELIFPGQQTLSNTFDFKQLSAEEEREYQDLFQGVIGA
ncbi:MAG: extracellular solute-binding protein [Actinomycetota bacterium]|nr:extracellular solute-binding protein [Actinomycetota bacterium]